MRVLSQVGLKWRILRDEKGSVQVKLSVAVGSTFGGMLSFAVEGGRLSANTGDRRRARGRSCRGCMVVPRAVG